MEVITSVLHAWSLFSRARGAAGGDVVLWLPIFVQTCFQTHTCDYTKLLLLLLLLLHAAAIWLLLPLV
jgi:hypothetical protein